MYKGVILLLLAEFCFALATVFAKLATIRADIPAVEITFFRFFFGVFLAYAYLRKTGLSIVPKNKKFVIWRAVLNTTAVILFFSAVKHTTVTNANMLNMTYPIFIFLFMPIFGKEKITPVQFLYLILSIIGVYLVIQPNFNHLQIGDLLGLLSGVVGGASILSLRRARETESTALILFYIMGIGTIINGLFLIPVFKMPDLFQFFNIIISALLGVGGQVFVTSGYKYIEANKGSVISSSRIIFAVILGVVFFNDHLNLKLMIGGGLILFCIIQSTLRERNKSHSIPSE